MKKILAQIGIVVFVAAVMFGVVALTPHLITFHPAYFDTIQYGPIIWLEILKLFEVVLIASFAIWAFEHFRLIAIATVFFYIADVAYQTIAVAIVSQSFNLSRAAVVNGLKFILLLSAINIASAFFIIILARDHLRPKPQIKPSEAPSL